jgi:hypothetical protein
MSTAARATDSANSAMSTVQLSLLAGPKKKKKKKRFAAKCKDKSREYFFEVSYKKF